MALTVTGDGAGDHGGLRRRAGGAPQAHVRLRNVSVRFDTDGDGVVAEVVVPIRATAR